jgi:dihydrolipoamide dehydrogenase
MTSQDAPPVEGGDLDCDLVVLGAGPGGYSAAFRAADLGLKVVLVERYPVLGGVCLNVGCIPSKALLHVAALSEAAAGLSAHGISFGPPQIDLEKLRAWKDKIVERLTKGLAGMALLRKVEVLRGTGRFLDAHSLSVGERIVRFRHAIVAAGSQAVRLPFLPDDPRIVESTGALELRSIPKRLLVIGGGIIGLEMATIYSALGARIEVVERLGRLMPGPDDDLLAVWQARNAHRFDRIMLETEVTGVVAREDGLLVSFAGPDAPEPLLYDMILQAAGRRPNGHAVGADAAGVHVDERGFIPVDGQMRTNVPHIFAIGDVAGAPMLAHKAVHEGHVAAEAASGLPSHFAARVIPSVAYTDPEVAWVGVTEADAAASGGKVEVARFPWAASGRAIANGAEYGLTKLLFDAETHRIVGGGIVGPGAGDLIGEVALAIEMGADAVDIGRTIHPHPTLSETIGMAADVFEGICTDLPPARR